MTDSKARPRRDDFADALVRSAKLDAPRPGARSRALSRLDARARQTIWLVGCAPHGRLLLHGLRMAASAALIAASIRWAAAEPSTSYDTTDAAGCRTNVEWEQPTGSCGERVDHPGLPFVRGGSGGSSGSSSG